MWEIPAFKATSFFSIQHTYCVCVFVVNEGDCIQMQLKRMKPFADTVDIIIADGGSTDGSLDLQFLKEKNVRALLVKTGPGGLSAQMRMAFSYALDQGYEGIITMDGNNKDNPRAIPLFIEALKNGVDHAQGSRFIQGGKHEHTPVSRLLLIKYIHSPLISLAAKFRYTDTTNGFRAYSKRFLLDPRVSPFRNCFMFYELHYYLAIRAGQLKYKIKEIPVERIYPKEGIIPTKIKSWRDKLRILFTLLKACFSYYRPASPKAASSGHTNRILFFFISVILLFISFWITRRELPLFSKFQANSEALVTNTLKAHANGTYRYGGFMYSEEKHSAYASQYGLQQKIFNFLRPNAISIDSYVSLLHIGTMLFLAIVLALFLNTIFQEFGFGIAAILLGGIIASGWINLFAQNLYWVMFMGFLPFAYAWFFYTRLEKNFLLFTLSIGMLIFLKALNGYEYITNIILAPVTALVYFEMKTNTPFGRIVKKSIYVIGAGIGGFMVAIAFHLYQGMLYFGSFGKAIAVIYERASARTIGTDPYQTNTFWGSLIDYIKVLPQYVYGYPWSPDKISHEQLLYVALYVSSVLPLFLGIAALLCVWIMRKKSVKIFLEQKFTAFFAATICSYIATLSWAVLAIGHMKHHSHINNIIFYLPANLFAFVFIPVVIQKLWVFMHEHTKKNSK